MTMKSSHDARDMFCAKAGQLRDVNGGRRRAAGVNLSLMPDRRIAE